MNEDMKMAIALGFVGLLFFLGKKKPEPQPTEDDTDCLCGCDGE